MRPVSSLLSLHELLLALEAYGRWIQYSQQGNVALWVVGIYWTYFQVTSLELIYLFYLIP